MDGVSAGSVTGTHVPVALSHSTADAQVAVLPVHVVHSGTRLVTQPDTKVLDLDRALFWDFLKGKNYFYIYLRIFKVDCI